MRKFLEHDFEWLHAPRNPYTTLPFTPQQVEAIFGPTSVSHWIESNTELRQQMQSEMDAHQLWEYQYDDDDDEVEVEVDREL